MNDEDWTLAADALRRLAVEHRILAAPDKEQGVFQEATILNWNLKAKAHEVGGGLERARLWTIAATRPESGVLRSHKQDLDKILERIGVPDMFRRHPFESSADGQLTISFGWVEQLPPPEPDPKTGRNERCPCGSGRKFKKCCLSRVRRA